MELKSINKESVERKKWCSTKTPEAISKKLNNGGYKWVTRDGKILLIHRLVWEEQYGIILEGMDIHHKDGNKQNNKLENLEMLTRKQHKQRHKEMRKLL